MALSDGLQNFWRHEEDQGVNKVCSVTAEELAEVSGIIPVTSIAGKHGLASEYNASSYHAATADSVVPNGAADFTCVYWVQFYVLPGDTVRHDNVGRFHNTIAGSRRWLGEYSGIADQFQFRLQNESDTQFVVGSSAAASTLTWYQIALVVDVTNHLIKLSVNGAAFAELAWTGTVNLTHATVPRFTHGKVQGDSAAPTDDFNGLVDSVGVWSRALTIDEVEDLYNGGDGLDYQDILDFGAAPESPDLRHTYFSGLFTQPS